MENSLWIIGFGVLQLIVLIAGIFVTAFAKKHRGRGAMLGMFGCIVMLVGVLWHVLYGMFLPELVHEFEISFTSPIIYLGSGVGILIDIVGTLLLVFGVAARSNPAEQPAPAYQQQWQQPNPAWQQQPPQPGQPQPGWPPQQPPYGGQGQ
ncbi:hypothetical protein [Nonomuraea sediminis]|uniref:hypothetical protein n=1 Tax=Nonomuraea sediminis TaxID=2835864 RepID=UPI001BDCA36B|nr:hypothetical protein [Nonomuraea sediminis]